MNKPLAVLINETNLLEQMLVESQGTITPEIEKYLAVKESQLPEKVDGYSLVMDRFEHLEAYYKQRADFFSQVADQCKAVRERLKENIKYAMKDLGTDEVAGFDVRFKLQKVKPKLVVDDEAKIPKEYYKTVITESLDKEKLKEDLAIGKIEGAHLEESFSLKTYANVPKKKEKKNE